MSNKLKTQFVKLFIISYFLEAYYWFQVSTYFATTFTLICALMIVIGTTLIIVNTKQLICDRSQTILLIFVLYQILCSLLHGMSNITSPLLSIFLCASFFYTRRTESLITTYDNINMFSNIMNMIVIYGIYQFFARMFGLPFGEPIIEGHMVEGYNWSNIVYSIGQNVARSNAIFLEPSFFSQTAAINVLILMVKIIEQRHTWKTWFWVIINLAGMIVSLSGTGIIILVLGAMVFLLYERRIKELKRIAFLSLTLIIIAILVLTIASGTDFGSKTINMFLVRFGEIGGALGTQMSGYLRFVSGFNIVRGIWMNSTFNFLFGGGAGTAEYYSQYYHGLMDANGYFKVAGELGLIGIVLFVLFFLSVIKKCRNHPDRCVWILGFSIPIMFACNGGFQQNYVWILLSLINISVPDFNSSNFFQSTDKINRINRRSIYGR